MKANSVWSPFRYSNYTLFWICTFISSLGTWIRDVAASWVMTHLTHSPLTISLLAFSSSLPVVLFSIPGGFWADHGNRRKILILAHAIMMVSAAFLGFQVANDTASELSMIVLSFAMGVGVALNGPAYQIVLSELVPESEQQNAVLVYYIGLNMARVLGPATGGFILGFWGAQTAFFLDAVSYLGLLIYFIRWPLSASETTAPARKFLASDWEIFIGRKNLRLWLEILVVSFAASCLWALYPVRGRIELQLGSLQYGSLLGFLGLGASLSVLFADKLMHPAKTKKSLGFAYLIFAAAEIVLAFADDYPLACLAMTMAGVGWIVLATLMNMSTRLISVSSPMKATMLGVFLTVFYLGMSFGSLTWGIVANQLSTFHALVISSGLLTILSMFKFRKLGK